MNVISRILGKIHFNFDFVFRLLRLDSFLPDSLADSCLEPSGSTFRSSGPSTPFPAKGWHSQDPRPQRPNEKSYNLVVQRWRRNEARHF
jgi:hypothetical protein